MGYKVTLDWRSAADKHISYDNDWRGGGKEVSNREHAQLLQRTTAYKQSPLLRPVKALYALAEKTLGALSLADNLAAVLRKRPP